jgi:hypothetical protein
MHYLCLMVSTEKKQDAAEGDASADSGRMEYIVLGVLLFAALMAFPAFRDIQKLQDFVIAICAGG